MRPLGEAGPGRCRLKVRHFFLVVNEVGESQSAPIGASCRNTLLFWKPLLLLPCNAMTSSVSHTCNHDTWKHDTLLRVNVTGGSFAAKSFPSMCGVQPYCSMIRPPQGHIAWYGHGKNDILFCTSNLSRAEHFFAGRGAGAQGYFL